MLSLDDPAIEELIAYLSFPISPTARRAAFRDAARIALCQISCLDVGIAYRTVAVLQRDFFDPPDDHRAAWDIANEPRVNKLTRAPPIKDGRDLRYRRHIKLLG
jgi:hypothetical protein